MNKFFLMFVTLLGSFTYAQTEREIRLTYIQTLTSTNTTIVHSDDTENAGDVFTISNGIDSEIERPFTSQTGFYGYVENIGVNHLSLFYGNIETKVKNLQASYSRTRELENLGDGIVTVNVEILWPDTTYTSTKISIFNGETLVWDTVIQSLLDDLSITDYENHLTNITNLVDDQKILSTRVNQLIAIIENYPDLTDIKYGDFTVDIDANTTAESWGIQYSFTVPGFGTYDAVALTTYEETKNETTPVFSLIFMSQDQFNTFASELNEQAAAHSQHVPAGSFDFSCN